MKLPSRDHLYDLALFAVTVASRRADFTRSVRDDPEPRGTLFRPYRNVVRMHVLIFVFAGLEAAGLSGYAVYPVLFFYFFPLDALKSLVLGQEAGGVEPAR